MVDFVLDPEVDYSNQVVRSRKDFSNDSHRPRTIKQGLNLKQDNISDLEIATWRNPLHPGLQGLKIFTVPSFPEDELRRFVIFNLLSPETLELTGSERRGLPMRKCPGVIT